MDAFAVGLKSPQDFLRDPAVPRGKDLELRIDEVSTNILADEPLNHQFLGSKCNHVGIESRMIPCDILVLEWYTLSGFTATIPVPWILSAIP